MYFVNFRTYILLDKITNTSINIILAHTKAQGVRAAIKHQGNMTMSPNRVLPLYPGVGFISHI